MDNVYAEQRTHGRHCAHCTVLELPIPWIYPLLTQGFLNTFGWYEAATFLIIINC